MTFTYKISPWEIKIDSELSNSLLFLSDFTCGSSNSEDVAAGIINTPFRWMPYFSKNSWFIFKSLKGEWGVLIFCQVDVGCHRSLHPSHFQESEQSRCWWTSGLKRHVNVNDISLQQRGSSCYTHSSRTFPRPQTVNWGQQQASFLSRAGFSFFFFRFFFLLMTSHTAVS